MMYEFSSDTGWYPIKGRGWSIGIEKEQIPEGMWEPNDLSGQEVMINGKLYTVRGVETFRISRSPERPYPYGIGLLVSDEEYKANNES